MLSTLSDPPELSVKDCWREKNWKRAMGRMTVTRLPSVKCQLGPARDVDTEGIQSWVKIKSIIIQKVRKTN